MLGGGSEVFGRRLRAHRLLERRHAAHRREKRVDPRRVAGLRAVRNAARKRDHRLPVSLRKARNARRRLAHRRLRVEPALAGHNHVRRADLLRKPRLLQNDRDARLQRRAEEGPQRKAHAARRAGTGEIRVAFGEHRFGKGRKPAQPAVHLRDVRRFRALLRAEHRAAAERAAERVFHVARRAECAAAQFRQYAARGDGAQARKPGRTARDRRAVFVQQVEPERLQHPRAAVVRRAAAEADHKPAAAAGYGVADHLAHAEGRRRHRVALFRGHLRQTRRARHLDDREAARNAVPADDRRAERPRDLD